MGLVLPDEGFHAELRRLTHEAGALLAYDETHTQVVGPGGLTALWGLEPDFVTAGKSMLCWTFVTKMLILVVSRSR